MVCQRWCVTKMCVCDRWCVTKMVCGSGERWCETKGCVKDGVSKLVCDKVGCKRRCVKDGVKDGVIPRWCVKEGV